MQTNPSPASLAGWILDLQGWRTLQLNGEEPGAPVMTRFRAFGGDRVGGSSLPNLPSRWWGSGQRVSFQSGGHGHLLVSESLSAIRPKQIYMLKNR